MVHIIIVNPFDMIFQKFGSFEGIVTEFTLTVSTQLERRRSNFRPRFFGAFAFKFEPNLTVLIKYLPQKVDFC